MGEVLTPAITVAAIGKNKRDEVRVVLDTFKGQQLVDVRVFTAFTASSDTVLAPTKKGVSLQAALLPELIEALTAARNKAEEMGWIGGAE